MISWKLIGELTSICVYLLYMNYWQSDFVNGIFIAFAFLWFFGRAFAILSNEEMIVRRKDITRIIDEIISEEEDKRK